MAILKDNSLICAEAVLAALYCIVGNDDPNIFVSTTVTINYKYNNGNNQSALKLLHGLTKAIVSQHYEEDKIAIIFSNADGHQCTRYLNHDQYYGAALAIKNWLFKQELPIG